jgi:hypothetical protein
MSLTDTTRRLIGFALLMRGLTSTVTAQQIILSTEIEKNIAGINYGTSMVLSSRKNVSFGGFYQFALQRTGSEIKKSRPFYGLQLQLPLAARGRMSICGSARAGFVNENFFVFVPAVVTTVRLSDHISFSVGAGMRMQNPTLSGKLHLTI